jgi:hypothetical protein
LIEKIQPDESILQIYSTKTKYLTVQFIYIWLAFRSSSHTPSRVKKKKTT